MKIQLHNQTKEDIKEIKDILQRIFKPIKQEKNMQIIFLEQEAIHNMNMTYRKIDRPTDVLSFINDDLEDDSLGDIFVSIEQARLQASDYGHSFERELLYLFTHSMFHLLGYDHMNEDGKKKMREKEERVMEGLLFPQNETGGDKIGL
jgi:probable rRNA maturation factor